MARQDFHTRLVCARQKRPFRKLASSYLLKLLGSEIPVSVPVGRGILAPAKAAIGANAVLLPSTGEDEIWAGAPARCVGQQPRPEEQAA